MKIGSFGFQFGKLERVEIGGTRGKSLTATAKTIMHDFQKQLEQFQRVEYDVLMAPAKAFDEDYERFDKAVNKLERRLSTVILRVLLFHLSSQVVWLFRLLMIAIPSSMLSSIWIC